MDKILRFSLFDLIMSIANTVDLISPVLLNHHRQVAYLSYAIAQELNLSWGEKTQVVLAAALHDIGGLSLKERIDALSFEVINPYQHAENGYLLLSSYGLLENVAQIVRYHHTRWDEIPKREVPLGSHIIHLADRIAVLINPSENILGQRERILRKILSQKGKMFKPELVEIFEEIYPKEYIWLDTVAKNNRTPLKHILTSRYIEMDITELQQFTQIFSRIVDFRSSFTARHSSGVAAAAEVLAAKLGFSVQEQKMMKIASYLHDLGKLAIPKEILEKPGKLTAEEFNLIKTHPYYTYQTLAAIEELETINKWSSFHHERLDGTGYPFHLKGEEIPLGARILAVADVYTALTENRPYRQGMEKEDAVKILMNMGKERALDVGVINMLRENYEEINWRRVLAQQGEERVYDAFLNKNKMLE